MKNKPEKAVPPGTNFLLRMLIGDITEAVFKGVLTEAGVNYKMDFHNKVLEPLNRFETKENPYWFGEIE